MYNLYMYLYPVFNSNGIEEECIYSSNDYPLHGLRILDNSSILFNETIYLYGSTSYPINYIINIKNNSYVNFNNASSHAIRVNLSVENGSTFYADNLTCDILAINSTVLTKDLTIFDNSTFINSKLIEYK